MAIAALSSVLPSPETVIPERQQTASDVFAELLRGQQKSAAPTVTRAANLVDRDRIKDVRTEPSDDRAADRTAEAEESSRRSDAADRGPKEKVKDTVKEKPAAKEKEKVREKASAEPKENEAVAETDTAPAAQGQETAVADKPAADATSDPAATQAAAAPAAETAATEPVLVADVLLPVTIVPVLAPQLAAETNTTPAGETAAGADATQPQATPVAPAAGLADSGAQAPVQTLDAGLPTDALAAAPASADGNEAAAAGDSFLMTANRFGIAAQQSTSPGNSAQHLGRAATQASAVAQQQSRALSSLVSDRSTATVQVSRDAASLPSGQAGGLAAALTVMMGETTDAETGASGQNGSFAQDLAAQIEGADLQLAVDADMSSDFVAQLQAETATVGGEAHENANTAQNTAKSDAGQQVTGTAPVGTVARTERADSVAATAAPRAQTVAPHPAEQIRVAVSQAIEEGKDRITMQLRPERLGHIEVKMEMGQDGRMTAAITADNKDTLQMLQRDARDLQKALQDAGFDTDQRDLSFSLRQGREQGEQNAGRGSRGRRGGGSEAVEAPVAAAAAPQRTGGPFGAVDIRV